MGQKKDEEQIESKMEDTKFSKEQIISSAKFQKNRDLLEAILSDGYYTLDEIEITIQNFMKGKVIE